MGRWDPTCYWTGDRRFSPRQCSVGDVPRTLDHGSGQGEDGVPSGRNTPSTEQDHGPLDGGDHHDCDRRSVHDIYFLRANTPQGLLLCERTPPPPFSLPPIGYGNRDRSRGRVGERE